MQRGQNSRNVTGAVLPLLVETAGNNVLGSTPNGQPALLTDIENMVDAQLIALEEAFNLPNGQFGDTQPLRRVNALRFYTAPS
jgi:hypothetical protein